LRGNGKSFQLIFISRLGSVFGLCKLRPQGFQSGILQVFGQVFRHKNGFVIYKFHIIEALSFLSVHAIPIGKTPAEIIH
jgi:hypothetical protein